MSEQPNVMVVTCPSCGHRMKAPGALLGKTTSCLKCGNKFQVTRAHTAPLKAPGGKSEAKAPARRSPIADVLIKNELISSEQAREAELVRAEKGGSFLEILIELGHLDKGRFNSLMASQPGMASIDLKNYHVSQEFIALVPAELARERLVLPIDKLGKLITLAMVCPVDTVTIKEVQEMTGLRVNPVLCDLDDIGAAFQKYLPSAKETGDADFSWMTGLAPKAEEPPPVAVAEPKPAPPPKEAPPAQAPPTRAEEKAEADLALRDRVVALLSEIDVLPASPETLQRIEEASRDPHYPIRDLSVLCSADPALVAKLLSVTNAAAYGMPDRVDNANLATTLLGLAGVLKVIKAVANAPSIKPVARFDYAAFLSRSRFCAAAAQAIARATGKAAPAAALTAGLLHKIGWLALACLLPDQFGSLDPQLGDAERLKAERKQFGLTHPEAGHLLAQNWRLPSAIAQAVRLQYHAAQAVEVSGVAAAVALAAHMAEVSQRGAGADGFQPQVEILRALNLEPAEAGKIFQDTAMMFNP